MDRATRTSSRTSAIGCLAVCSGTVQMPKSKEKKKGSNSIGVACRNKPDPLTNGCVSDHMGAEVEH